MDAMIDDETLDRQLREVMPYIDDEGFTARVLDIPLGTVKTNVLRGREKLKRTLAAWGPN